MQTKQPQDLVTRDLVTTLDETLELLNNGQGIEAVAGLCQALQRLHGELGDEEFQQTVIPPCRTHPLFAVIQQDPYSARAYQKPRGYAGDAVMLDFIYDGVPPDGVTEVGQAVFAGTTRTTNGLSVVYRRDYLRRLVDEVAISIPQPRVCSLAAGHLREAAGSIALREGKLGEWIAIDRDARSLEVIQQDYPSPAIHTIEASVVDLVRGTLLLEHVDLFYSAGLFDYLNDRLAAKTVVAMFDLLRPGGTLVVSNFTPESSGRHFMHAFMDWQLVYRNQQAMYQLADSLPEEAIRTITVDQDPYGNIVYLKVLKV